MIEGKNFIIHGGTFNQTVSRSALNICFDQLAQKASPLAFHLADCDLSHSTCFTNTRTKILERMKRWALRDIETDKFIMWLHGPAGGGKTAIGRTIAKWCEEQGILLGEFFFSRANATRGQLASLAPTLAYRMAVHTLQDAKEAISKVVDHDPHIFLAPLAVQLKKLVLEPLNLFAPCGIVPHVIILDGLDETLSPDDQQLVLNVISETLYRFNPTLRILICCRPEPTIVTAFNDTDSILKDISTTISLNDDVDADADIRAFLVEKFARTKKQLPHPPSEDWPAAANIDYLVAKSSGQFIFAATVERYVCSPKHRHQAVARLKHVLDLRLLPHLEDKKKHPFADLDALYFLILQTRNDVNMSVKATAVCLQYPKYFNTISPEDLSKVLNIELSETWAILYELASLFETSEESIRPFHASFGDFLFDSSRSLDFFRDRGDIVGDITCAMLKHGRDPEVLSYHAFSQLLGEATPRQDLGHTLSRMTPIEIFGRPARTRDYEQRSKGAYYLIPLLRQLEKHFSSDAYKDLATYFDEHFKSFLPSGYWRSTIFARQKMPKVQPVSNSDDRVQSVSDSDDYMPELQSVSNTDESDSDDDEQFRSMSGSAVYPVSELTPLSTSPAWDEIYTSLNIRLTGPGSLKSLCDEAHFARSHLGKTLSVLLDGSTQEDAALFCLTQIQDKGITEDLFIAFAKLLPHSVLHAEHSEELRTAIQRLKNQHPTLYQRLPSETQKAITEYLGPLASAVARTGPKVSSAYSRPPVTTTKSSIHATTGQKPTTTPNSSSTARKTTRKSSPSPQRPLSTGSKCPTQPVTRTSHSTQTRPSPSASQKASTASRARNTRNTSQPSTSTNSKSAAPSQPQPVPRTSQPSGKTQPSLGTNWKHLAVPRTPSASQPATPEPESSTTRSPSATSKSTSGPSESLTSTQSLSGSSQRRHGPSQHRKSGKGRKK